MSYAPTKIVIAAQIFYLNKVFCKVTMTGIIDMLSFKLRDQQETFIYNITLVQSVNQDYKALFSCDLSHLKFG